MRALAVETSGRVGSVAIVEDGVVLREAEFPHGLQHAAGIVLMADELCRAQGWSPRELAELYVSAGPGSFTGLRIGITVAKTIGFATGCKLVAVPTVRVLAENAPAEAQHVIIVLDAKRDQVFTARFERQGGNWLEREPAHLGALTDMLARAPRPVHLLGEGIPYHARFVPAEPGIIVTDDTRWRARASAVATIGAEMARRGQFADAYRLAPIYIRPPEAEEKWAQNNPAGGPAKA